MRKLKLVQQSEATECGLASLLMVANYHGHRLSLGDARQRLDVGEPNLQSVLRLAGELGLDARPVRASLDEIDCLRTPAILHWDLQHFVVLARVTRRRVEILDPAQGRRKISRATLSRSFTGVAIEFSRLAGCEVQASERPLSPSGLLASFRGLWRYLAMMLALLVTTQILALVVPVATQLLIDEVVRGQDLGWLRRVIAGLACVMLAMIVLDILRQRFSLFTGIQLSVDTAAAIVRRVLALPPATLERRSVADTLSRIDSMQPLLRLVTDSGLELLVQSVTLVCTFALMFFYSPLLTAFSLAALFVTLLVQALLLPRTRERNLDTVVASAVARQSLTETLRGFASVTAFGLAGKRLNHWRHSFVRASNARAAAGRLGIVASGLQALVGALDQLAFLWLGIASVADKGLTLGALFALTSLRGRLGAAAGSLVLTGRDIYLLRTHADRVGELLAETPRPAAGKAALRATYRGALECRDLAFRYSSGKQVLGNFSCAIGAGERVAICGPSGIGKTTLLRLLATEIVADAGSIAYDGTETGFWNLAFLREQVAFVRQQDTLFTGSVGDNISGFAEAPDFARLRHAARLACIWEDLVELPMKLETPLIDGGPCLSGGQVQRVLLARALYRRPRLLLLDEATNQLDDRTETQVLANLAGLGITIVSIAHGEKTLRQSGRPLVLPVTRHGNCRVTIP